MATNTMASDSEDEYYDVDTSLPRVPDDEDAFGKADMSKLLTDGKCSFEFSLPEVLETDGFRQHGQVTGHKPFVCHQETMDRMSLKMWDKDDETALNLILGDFSEIEYLMDIDVLKDGRLKKVVINYGTGKEVKENHIVTAHFIVSGEYMDDLIDSTYAQRRPRRFRVGAMEVLPMLDLGIQTMRVGEVAKFLATPDLAFGKLGVPMIGGDCIPPDLRVLMLVEVLYTQPIERNDAIRTMSPAELRQQGYEALYQYALEMKKEGNREFHDKDYEVAIRLYRDGLDCAKEMEAVANIPNQRAKYVKMCQDLLNNLAQAYFKLGKFKSGLKYAKHSTEFSGDSASQSKAYYWAARSSFELGQYKEALAFVKKADYYKWSDADIKELLEKIQMKVKEEDEKEKVLCGQMMKASLSE